ncbi:wall-associated receptor kinase-like 10 [Carya illinoinensis]|uniref:wall-associated receptor kinase-like 10 n=1 Tax=Carya illinoinensis TaxID=32201 RepID=UPI001C724B8F|nr:wall-associated receptor kinase-like 10 [Carya illinoinensis]
MGGLHAAMFAFELNLSSVVLEGDSLQVVQGLSLHRERWDSVGLVFSDTRAFLSNFIHCSVSFVRRSGNQKAHCLAKEALEVSEESSTRADIDQNPCNATATCTNTNGSYACICPNGYEGDGMMPPGTGCSRKGQSKIIIIALVIEGEIEIHSMWLKLKQKFFQQNGGLILRQQLLSHKESVESAKIFSAEELEKATNNYDKSRVLGHGGFGTVYKGVLSDNKVVAIKKSNVVDQIYEFITNGTFFYHIHDKSLSSLLSWEKRLKIASETVGALAYIHFETSMSIIHRDVKTTNILLDDKYAAKVSDFRASRPVLLDHTQLTTMVLATLGYLDPEYFHSSHLIEKSDVYSFGVVIAELLTGEKAVSMFRLESERNLAMFLKLQ